MMQARATALVALALLAGSAAAQVGDPHSFSRAIKWRGGFIEDAGVVLRADCSSSVPTEHCVQLLPAPQFTDFEVSDLDTIVLPGNSASARSLLCEVVSPYINYSVYNPDFQAARSAQVSAAATLRIESSVLQDPQLINPQTGQPFNGFIEEMLPGAHFFLRTLEPRTGDSIADRDRSRFCDRGVVSKARLMDIYGLSATQANAVFASDITLRLGIRGWVTLVNGGQLLFNIRFLSD